MGIPEADTSKGACPFVPLQYASYRQINATEESREIEIAILSVATHILAFEGDSHGGSVTWKSQYLTSRRRRVPRRVPRRRHVEVFNGNWAEYAANRLERGLGDEVSNFKYRKLVEA